MATVFTASGLAAALLPPFLRAPSPSPDDRQRQAHVDSLLLLLPEISSEAYAYRAADEELSGQREYSNVIILVPRGDGKPGEFWDVNYTCIKQVSVQGVSYDAGPQKAAYVLGLELSDKSRQALSSDSALRVAVGDVEVPLEDFAADRGTFSDMLEYIDTQPGRNGAHCL